LKIASQQDRYAGHGLSPFGIERGLRFWLTRY
jgi:hypothetical protein